MRKRAQSTPSTCAVLFEIQMLNKRGTTYKYRYSQTRDDEEKGEFVRVWKETQDRKFHLKSFCRDVWGEMELERREREREREREKERERERECQRKLLEEMERALLGPPRPRTENERERALQEVSPHPTPPPLSETLVRSVIGEAVSNLSPTPSSHRKTKVIHLSFPPTNTIAVPSTLTS